MQLEPSSPDAPPTALAPRGPILASSADVQEEEETVEHLVVHNRQGVPVPVHLLWEDVNPVLTASKKKKAGWGLKKTSDEYTPPEARGVRPITLGNLPGYSSAAGAPAPCDESMDVDADDVDADDDADDAQQQPRHASSNPRNRRVVADDDDE